MTTDRWLIVASDRLRDGGVEFPQMEARAILQQAAAFSKEQIVSSASAFDEQDANQLLERRLLGEPLAYVLGYKEFFGREFRVNSNVLIPRPETELLAQLAIAATGPGTMCADIGTGSGCVGITIALEKPEAVLVCVDSSFDALNVAATNALDLGANVQLVHGDLLSPFAANTLDLVVSNPPYVCEGDPNLEDQVAQWEPPVALFAGDDGLVFIRRLVEEAIQKLKPGGKLMLELGVGQSTAVIAMLEGWQPNVERDLAGIERVVVATKPVAR